MRRLWVKCHWGIAAILVLAGSATGCGSVPEEETASSDAGALIQIRLVREETAPGVEPVEYDGDILYLESLPVLSDEDFESVEASVRPGELELEFQLTPRATERFISITSAEIGSQLAIVIDSNVRSAPVIRDALGPRGVIYVSASEEEANRLAGLVRARWREAS